MASDETATRTTRVTKLRGQSGTFLFTNEFGLVVLIVLFGSLFAFLSPGFLSPFNLFSLARVAAVNSLLGFAMMVVIVTGGLSLSVGAIGVCAAMSCGWLIQTLGVPWPLAVVGAIALGGVLGAINGVIIVRTGLHSFIVTLSTMSVFFGAVVFLVHSGSYRDLPEVFSEFGRARVIGPVAYMLVVAGFVGVFLSILYRYTGAGRAMLAAGANPLAARLSGILVGRALVYGHLLSGSIAGLTAVLVVARNGAALPSMAGQLGQDWLLPAFLAPVLGGALLAGGSAPVLGTFLGALLVTVLTNGMLLIQVGEYWVETCLGLILLLAVLADAARRTVLAKSGFA